MGRSSPGYGPYKWCDFGKVDAWLFVTLKGRCQRGRRGGGYIVPTCAWDDIEGDVVVLAWRLLHA